MLEASSFASPVPMEKKKKEEQIMLSPKSCHKSKMKLSGDLIASSNIRLAQHPKILPQNDPHNFPVKEKKEKKGKNNNFDSVTGN